MKNPYTTVCYGERVYLKDIYEIKTFTLGSALYGLSIYGISPSYIMMKYDDPRAWWSIYYYSKFDRDNVFKRLISRFKKYNIPLPI